jgi:CBS domain-containing protein/anti-sigma regulatory factor (Ser/Thr protein kinase)
MTSALPIDYRHSLVIRELINRLRVSDVMSADLCCATRDDSLKKVQQLMRTRGISGIPVAEQGRLYGIISVDDIIRALEKGHIDEPAARHMSRNVVTLESQTPLSIAIKQFEKYRYGRFPVIGQGGTLCGIVASRDILSHLLMEINREVDKLELLIPAHPQVQNTHFSQSWHVRRFDMERAGSVSSAIKKKCRSLGMEPKIVRRIAVAVYELELNQVVHSNGGSISCSIDEQQVKIVAHDDGPGIPDTDQAMQEGFSTAIDWIRSLGFGAGMGLPNVCRVSDDFSIESQCPGETIVRVAIYLTSPKEHAHEGN